MVNNKIYYYTYKGLPLASASGSPIHSDRMEDLPDEEWLREKFSLFNLEDIKIHSMDKHRWYTQRWPK